MLASRVQEKGGFIGGWGAAQFNFAALGVLPVIPALPACRHMQLTQTRNRCSSHPCTQELAAAAASDRIYTQLVIAAMPHTRSACMTLPVPDTHASHRSSTRSRWSTPDIQQSSSLLHRCNFANSLVCYKTDFYICYRSNIKILSRTQIHNTLQSLSMTTTALIYS